MNLFKTVLGASAIAAVALLSPVVGSTPAGAVTHNGNLMQFSNLGGVRFSFVHRSANGSGSATGSPIALTADAPLAYDWNPTGGTNGIGALTFNVDDFELYADNRYTIDLVNSNASVLNLGTYSSIGKTPFNGGGFSTDNTVDGSLKIRITDSQNSVSILDTVIFKAVMQMGPINGIDRPPGDIGDFFTFLWGDSGDSVFDEAVTGDTSGILGKFYGNNGVGFDLAFSGVEVVPVPAALPLLGTALAGIFLVGRRRRKFAA
ncbi:MAG: VPLPA-CTERM sorting domain-containing protein [Alphaproteobacteria bacterium]